MEATDAAGATALKARWAAGKKWKGMLCSLRLARIDSVPASAGLLAPSPPPNGVISTTYS